jgi:hypothetical protein
VIRYRICIDSPHGKYYVRHTRRRSQWLTSHPEDARVFAQRATAEGWLAWVGNDAQVEEIEV